MRMKAKLILLAFTTSSFVLQLWGGECWRFWGDVTGDFIFLRGVD